MTQSHFSLPWLDVSGEDIPPTPIAANATCCALCKWPAERLFKFDSPLPKLSTEDMQVPGPATHALCSLCWLSLHLDSPSAAYGVLCWLPGISPVDVINLQRMALIASLDGNRGQKKTGRKVLKWLFRHKKETDYYWKSVRPVEFAQALSRQHPDERLILRKQLAGTHLVMSLDAFSDSSLLLPAGITAEQLLATLTLPAL